MNKPEFVVIHTAVSEMDATIDDVRQWHKERGFRDVGYHYVIEGDGKQKIGRDRIESGAHVRGLNARSIGICVIGHGDKADFNDEQYEILIPLVGDLCVLYKLDSDLCVLGHGECKQISGVPDPHKTCPGTKVDMSRIRKMVSEYIDKGECT